MDLSDTPIAELPNGIRELANLNSPKPVSFGQLHAVLVRALIHLEQLLMITNDSGSLWGSIATSKHKGAWSTSAFNHSPYQLPKCRSLGQIC
ncbi:hypothetical protein ACFX2C_035894 [Malus domestica]